MAASSSSRNNGMSSKSNPRQMAGSCHCVVPGCSNEFYKTKSTGRHHHYHSLPLNRRDVLRRWLDAMSVPKGETPPVGGRVCSDHFTAADYNEKYRLDGDTGKQVLVRSNHLKRDAVPSVFINCGGKGETAVERSAASASAERINTSGEKQHVPPRRMTTEDMPPEDMEITSWEWGEDPSDGTNAQTASSGAAAAATPRQAAGGAWASGAAVHLQCPLCGHFSKSHAHLLTHAADVHPSHLDSVPVGRLGAIMIYQSTAKLFHCYRCYFTTKYFPNLYDHIVSTHCMDRRKDAAGGGGGEDGDKPADSKAEEVEEEGEAQKVGEEDSLKRKRSSEGDDDKEEGEGEEGEDGGAVQKENDTSVGAEVSAVSAAASDESKGVLRLEGTYFCCQVCDFKTQLKGMGITHVVKKHKIPRAYAYATAPTKQSQQSSSCPNEEEASSAMLAAASNMALMASSKLSLDSSSDLLTEEMKARAKVVKFAKSRYICLICGWKTKSKGFIFSHVVRSHDVERPYSCKECQHSFFLPSHLQQHMSTQHRAGCYGCPFCSFRSRNVGGFKRHCRRCAARDGGEEGGGGGGGGGEEKGEEEGAEASDGEEEKGEGEGEEASEGEQEKGEKKGQEEGEKKGEGEQEKGEKKGQEKGEGEGASDGEQEKGEKKGQEEGEEKGE